MKKWEPTLDVITVDALTNVEMRLEAIGRSICGARDGAKCHHHINAALAELRNAIRTAWEIGGAE